MSETLYQILYDHIEMIHILEDYDLICSMPLRNLEADESKQFTLTEIKEFANDSKNRVCFNCKQNINNH